jgi:hypothetical protein
MNWLYQIQISSFKDELSKLASFKEGKKYPSKEMKKEYDAANDNVHEDLDAATNYSPKYPTDHMSIKTAADKFVAQYLVGKNVDGRIRRVTQKQIKEAPVIGQMSPEGDISHGNGEQRSYD